MVEEINRYGFYKRSFIQCFIFNYFSHFSYSGIYIHVYKIQLYYTWTIKVYIIIFNNSFYAILIYDIKKIV